MQSRSNGRRSKGSTDSPFLITSTIVIHSLHVHFSIDSSWQKVSECSVVLVKDADAVNFRAQAP